MNTDSSMNSTAAKADRAAKAVRVVADFKVAAAVATVKAAKAAKGAVDSMPVAVAANNAAEAAGLPALKVAADEEAAGIRWPEFSPTIRKLLWPRISGT